MRGQTEVAAAPDIMDYFMPLSGFLAQHHLAVLLVVPNTPIRFERCHPNFLVGSLCLSTTLET